MDIDVYSTTLTGAQLGLKGDVFHILFENPKVVLISEWKALVLPTFG